MIKSKILRTVINKIWIFYYTILWYIRIEIWNRLVRNVDKCFESLDWYIRRFVGKLINDK